MEGQDILKLGLIKRIGDGESTNIWNDNWLPRPEMMRPYGYRLSLPPSIVFDLINTTNASWKRPVIEATFLPFHAKVIMGIPLCIAVMLDFWSWTHESTGQFTVRLAYNMLVSTKQRREAWLEGSATSSSNHVDEASWKSLWKTVVPSKLRMFLWRLSKQSLPTEDVRAHNHMSTTSSCGLCGAPDSWRHSLLECTVSRCIWALVDEDLGCSLVASIEMRAKS